jgi:hypothetical protein
LDGIGSTAENLATVIARGEYPVTAWQRQEVVSAMIAVASGLNRRALEIKTILPLAAGPG